MKKFLKWTAIVLGVLMVIGLIMPRDNDTSTSTSGSSTETSTSKPKVEIVSMDPTYESVTQTTTIHTEVKNNTDRLISYIDLKSVFRDENGAIVGTGIGNAANIPAGQTRVIDVMAMQISGAESYDVEIGNVMYD